MSLPLIYTVALTIALLFAWAKGSRAAQLLALGYLVIQIVAMTIDRGRWQHPQIGVFLTDLLLLGWIGWIVLRTPLTWPIALGVLQVLTVLGHLARLTATDMEKMGYYVLAEWTAWPALVTIVIGTVLDRCAGRTSPPFFGRATSRGQRTPPSS